jgi:hypothetical protein
VATWDDVRRVATSLPETTERGGATTQWRVNDKLFVWERPLRPADLAALGDAAPTGEILGARVPDLGAKQALVDAGGAYFTTPHFDGYPAVLVRLDDIDPAELEELIVEAWLCRAPKRAVRAFEANRPGGGAP